METLKVLHVLHSLGVGGAERSLINVLPELACLGYPSAVAILRPPLDLLPEFHEVGIRVTNLELRHRWDIQRGVLRMASCAAGGSFDVIHAHTFFPGIYGAFSRIISGNAARVVTFHDLGYETHPPDSAWQYLRKVVDKRTMNTYDVCISVSAAVAHHYSTHLNIADMRVIRNAVPIPELRSDHRQRQVRARYGLSRESQLIVTCGRLVAEKGHDVLIEAFAQLVHSGIVGQLLIAGEGAMRRRLEALIAQRGLRASVHLVGQLDHDEVLDLVGSADVYVQPSLQEGSALAVAEAMALGRMTIGSNVGGIPELLSDNQSGFLVRPSDPVALADVLRNALANPAMRQRFGTVARLRMIDKFSIPIQAQELASAYEDAVVRRFTRA